MLRAQRRAAGLSQAELARRAGVGLGTVRDLEQDRTRQPRPESVLRLAAALRLDPAVIACLAGGSLGPAKPPVPGGRGTDTGWLLQILGPLEVWRGGKPVALHAVKDQVMLGVLALAPNTVVSRQELILAAWGDQPPTTAVSLVQAYLSRLRRTLDPGRRPRDPDGRLVSVGTGYRLRAAPAELDLLAFEDLARTARAAAADGAMAQACAAYQQALAMWRADVLAGIDEFACYPSAAAVRHKWAAVVCDYADAACVAGTPGLVLPVLRDLVSAEPLDEKAHARLMIALAVAGQQAAALRVHDELRHRLETELGVSPGPEVSEAHLRILRQEIPPGDTPVPAAPPAAPTRTGAVPAAPRQLPRGVAHFTGRQAGLAWLAGLLERDGAVPGAGVVAVITGTAGVGKTALALHWAHQAAHRFPDGQMYVNLRGVAPSGTPVTPAEAVRRFLDALAVSPDCIPPGADAQVSLYRSLLADKRMLIVLDNARDEGQVRPLLPASPGSLVIVTSRSQLPGLAATDGAWLLSLDVLAHDEAVQLFTARIGDHRAAAEPAAVSEIARLCARLPLALAVAAARAAARPRFPLTELATELRGVPGRLDALDTGDPASSVAAVLSWSYQQLDPEAARMFRLLGLHPGPDISVRAAASLTAADEPPARRLLRELARGCLITEHAPGRYAFHDLLRAYAARKTMESDSQSDRDAAIGRVLDHYLHTAARAALVLRPGREPLALAPPSPGTRPGQPGCHGQALTWFEAEHHVLLAVVTLAAETGADSHAWQLPCVLKEYLYRRGYPNEGITTLDIALAAATRLDDTRGQAMSRRALGGAYTETGNYDQARTQLERCLPLYQRLGDRMGEAWAQQGLSRLAEVQGRYADALGHDVQALRLYQAIGDKDSEALLLNGVGWCHALLGDYQRARAFCGQSLALITKLGSCDWEYNIWDTLGYIELHLGNFSQAIAHFQSALSLCRDHGDRINEAEILTHVGDAHHAAGDLPHARQAWQQALATYEGIQHPDAAKVRAKLAGRRRGSGTCAGPERAVVAY